MTSVDIQIKAVFPGLIGGAIFKGDIVGTSEILVCKAKYNVLDRTPDIGEIWSVTGTQTMHAKYGPQFIVSEALITSLSSSRYTTALLVRHPAFRGFHLGKAKVTRLLNHFGADRLFDLLNSSNAGELASVIDQSIAQRLVDSWAILSNEIETMRFLRAYRFDSRLIKAIIRLSRNNTVERLKKNPYALVCFNELSQKIWRNIEAAAKKLGISKTDNRRLIGAVEYVLYKRLSEGHTAIPITEFREILTELLQEKELAETAISESLRQRYICALTIDSETLLQLISVAYIEQSVEKQIVELLKAPPTNYSESLITRSVTSYSNAFYSAYGYKLSDEQQNATCSGLMKRLSLITGFGGTGKTTTLKAIGNVCSTIGRPVVFLALSGKAKERVSQATGRAASTIHSFITAVTNNTIDLPHDPLIVIDEASMVDISLFNRLLMLFKNKPYSLLLVGDTMQLSPVGFGLLWHRLVRCNAIHAAHLTEVHRQHEQSPIHNEAMRIRKGEYSTLSSPGEMTEGIFLEDADPELLTSKLIQLKLRHPEAQVLTPYVNRKMRDSAFLLNEVLQEKLNPQEDGSSNISINGYSLRESDPIIFTRNNYALGVFNGTTGKIDSIQVESGRRLATIKLEHSNETIDFTEDDLFETGVELAYAISVHKSQGSEYEKIIFCCISNSRFIERSLIYTGITRAKSLCIIVGSNKSYSGAVKAPPRADKLCVGISFDRISELGVLTNEADLGQG